MVLKEKVISWGNEIWKHKFLIILSIILLVFASFLSSFAGKYADRMGDESVSDLILDSIKPMNLGFIFVYGYIFITALLFIYPLFFEIKFLHVAISQFSLLVIIRGLFVCLTHLKAPAGALAVDFPGFLDKILFSNDLFFSGHVAVAFLGFLIFKKNIRWFFLASSFVMAFTVLAMHVHYSIDVFAAFFITYGSYKIGRVFFDKFGEKFSEGF